MGQVLGRALPFMTILSLLTALGFIVPLMHNIEYGPFEVDIDVIDVDILRTGSYNFTLKVSITNENASEVKLLNGLIGIYYDETHYTVISQYFLTELIIPSKETTVYYPEGTITLVDDNVPKIVYITIEGKYYMSGSMTDLEIERELDLEPYWP